MGQIPAQVGNSTDAYMPAILGKQDPDSVFLTNRL